LVNLKNQRQLLITKLPIQTFQHLDPNTKPINPHPIRQTKETVRLINLTKDQKRQHEIRSRIIQKEAKIIYIANKIEIRLNILTKKEKTITLARALSI